MVEVKLKIWSCKIHRPDTLKSHRSLEAATKKAGDHGFVYCPETDKVFQVHAMADGSLKRFDVASQVMECNTGSFDMRKAMAYFEIQTAGSERAERS